MFGATKNWWLEWNKIIKDINDNWMLIELEFIKEHKLKWFTDTNYRVIDNDLKGYIGHTRRAMDKYHSFDRLMYPAKK